MDTVDEGDFLLCAPEDPSTDSSSIHHHKRGTKIPDWAIGFLDWEALPHASFPLSQLLS